ncbi:MAG: MarR family transcriptional regulator [Anaerolineaceae bacterium]|nr:MarR family transcriptional regulator [Anaerolineaceae bacterium]
MKNTEIVYANEFSNKLLNLRWLSKKHLAEELATYQLTPSQYVTIKTIADQPQGIKMSVLAKQAHQVSATMTGIIDRLESQNLVIRYRVETDRRSVYVQLTDEGQLLLKQISAAKTVKFKEILDRLSDEEKELLFNVIDTATTYFSENLRGNS